MPIFPHSPTIDSVVDTGILEDIRDEAVNAFFKVVADRLNDYYPGSTTHGDIDPLTSFHIDGVAMEWLLMFAENNTAVQAATEQFSRETEATQNMVADMERDGLL